MSNPDDAARKMIASVPEKTGKTFEQWKKMIAADGGSTELEKHGQIVKHLKTEYAVTHGYANLIAQFVLGKLRTPGETGGLIEAQYSGKKEALRPICDRLIQVAKRFGGDVEIAPKKTSVSLRRKKQFAVITPATNTRVDIGIQLKGNRETKRLQACKSGSMTSHKVGLQTVDEIDKQLIGWMQAAYDKAC